MTRPPHAALVMALAFVLGGIVGPLVVVAWLWLRAAVFKMTGVMT